MEGKSKYCPPEPESELEDSNDFENDEDFEEDEVDNSSNINSNTDNIKNQTNNNNEETIRTTEEIQKPQQMEKAKGMNKHKTNSKNLNQKPANPFQALLDRQKNNEANKISLYELKEALDVPNDDIIWQYLYVAESYLLYYLKKFREIPNTINKVQQKSVKETEQCVDDIRNEFLGELRKSIQYQIDDLEAYFEKMKKDQEEELLKTKEKYAKELLQFVRHEAWKQSRKDIPLKNKILLMSISVVLMTFGIIAVLAIIFFVMPPEVVYKCLTSISLI